MGVNDTGTGQSRMDKIGNVPSLLRVESEVPPKNLLPRGGTR